MNLPRTILTGAIAACAALAPAAAQAAPTTLAIEQKPFSVTHAGSATAWSSYDARDRLYHLVATDGRGPAVRLPVPGSAEPFDVDAGSGPGSISSDQLVYSRCRRLGGPRRADGRVTDCDLYRYDFGSGREQTLRRVNSSADEREPSVDGDRVVFVRREPDRRNGGQQDVLRTDKIGSDAPSRRLFAASSRLNARLFDAQLRGDHVAFVAGRSYRECCYLQKLFLVRRSGRGLKSVYRAVSGGANAASIVTPTFSERGNELFWARTNNGSGQGNRYIRYGLRADALAYATGSSDIVSTSWVGGATGALSATEGGRLVATGPIAFDARP